MSDDLTAEVQAQPFFEGLGDAQCTQIATLATIAHFGADAYLAFEGRPALEFYLVREGEVVLQMFAGDLGFVDVERVTAGGMIGWSWLIPPHEWQLSAVASGSAEVLAFDAKRLQALCDEDSGLAFEISRRVAAVACRRLADIRRLLITYNRKEQGDDGLGD
jgi:CRP-like cAMP-binding protein